MAANNVQVDVTINTRVIRKGSFRELIRAVCEMDQISGVPQDIYVIEECSELIKELTKKHRGKEDEAKIFDEACDVLTTVFVLLCQNGATEEEVKDRIMYKCKRALSRYLNNKEV